MNYYNHIDELPIYNWLKISEGLINYSRKDLENGSEEDDLIYSEKLKDNYFEEFGFSNELTRLIEIQKDLAEARLDWIITEDNFIKNKIAMLEVEIEDLINSKDGDSDIDESIITLSKWLTYRIDVKVVTVKEFYTMVKLFKKEVELIRNNNKKIEDVSR